jgi:hypothetical protein
MEETRLESVRLRMALAEEEAKLAITDAEDFVREARRILEKLPIGNLNDH